jgi:hypothetical protein
VGGLVRAGDRALAFAGRVTAYDLLEPFTWPRSVLHAPTLTKAAAAFTAKNARFFAGYAVDAYRVPLSWTPPGRVFAGIGMDRLAVLEGDRVERTWGSMGGRADSATTFRASAAADPFEAVPPHVREAVGDGGDAVLALHAGANPSIVPAQWVFARNAVYAVMPAEVLSLARGGPDIPVGLVVDRASQWRAAAMTGVLIQGTGRIHRLARLRSGRKSAAAIAARAGVDPDDAALVHVQPARIVWWRGWDSGTVRT